MSIEEINIKVFDEFTNNHMLKNYFQSSEYGELMDYSNYSVMYIGAFNQLEHLVGASIILYKTIGPNIKYGYAPRGFILDYYDKDLLKTFTKKIKEYFFKKGFAFIKINPEIVYSIVDFKTKTKKINSKNKELIENLKSLGYEKLKDNMYFEAMLPKYTPIIDLKKYNMNSLDDSIKECIKNSELKGATLIIGNKENIKELYNFISYKDSKTEAYYEYFYNIFNKSKKVDVLFVEINYDIYVKYLQKEYIYQQEINDKINKKFEKNPKDEDLYNEKMESDKLVKSIASNIVTANERMKDNIQKEIVGGAFIVKHEGRVTIEIAGQNKNYTEVDIKTYMYYKIIESYKKAGYDFLDLFGITADFSDTNPYKELNEFKLKFNPVVYEYIGEFDLIINKAFHQLLWSTNAIQKEFYKPFIKKE